MRRPDWIIACFVVWSALLPSCSGGSDNPALTDIAKQYSKSYCTKLQDCMGDTAFQTVYPGGLEDCASRTLTISGTSEKSICTQEQWDTCTTDLEKTECVGPVEARRPKIPDSCLGC